ncbi:unnamed protein product, partial [marine sediment metagenome]
APYAYIAHIKEGEDETGNHSSSKESAYRYPG